MPFLPHYQEEMKKQQVEGWEYAPLFNMKFHGKERTMDLVRRRRWHRKMVSVGKGQPCFFNVQHEVSLLAGLFISNVNLF